MSADPPGDRPDGDGEGMLFWLSALLSADLGAECGRSKALLDDGFWFQ
jgi:hypothetical protein